MTGKEEGTLHTFGLGGAELLGLPGKGWACGWSWWPQTGFPSSGLALRPKDPSMCLLCSRLKSLSLICKPQRWGEWVMLPIGIVKTVHLVLVRSREQGGVCFSTCF